MTRKQAGPRITPEWPVFRFFVRLARGRAITYGDKHEGYWSDAQHGALRWGCLAWFVMWIYLIVAGWAQHVVPAWFPIYWLHVTAALLFIGAVHWLVFRIRNAVLFRNALGPLHLALAEIVGWPEDVKPWRWLHVPLGYNAREGAEIRVDLKHKSAQEDDAKTRIVNICAQKLGTRIDPADASWKLKGRRPHVLIRLAWPPPDTAWWTDNLDRIEKYTKPSVVAWGIGKHNKTITVDFDSDTPHAAMAATSGQGKSNTLAVGGAQLCKKGAILALFDPKLMSLHAFSGLSNVAYFAGAEQCHYGLLALYDELERREKLLAGTPFGQRRPDVGPDIYAFVEESDSLVELLREWWKLTEGTRNNCPSINKMKMLRNKGRELGIHQFVVTQSGSANALGGGDGRSAFGIRFISGDRAVWTKMAPGYKDAPNGESSIPGRWHFIKFGQPEEIQVFGFTPPPRGDEHLKFKEARDYAMSGHVAQMPAILQRVLDRPTVTLSSPNGGAFGAGPQAGVMGPVHKVVAHVVDHGPHGPASVPYLRLVEPGGPRSLTEEIAGAGYTVAPAEADRLLSLDEAVEAGYFPSIVAARSASKRSGFPASEMTRPAGTARGGRPAKLYRESELAALRHAGVS
jgi:hypothetical protein